MFETAGALIAVEPQFQLLLSLGTLITMVGVASMCVCCKKPMKREDGDDDAAYGVIIETGGEGGGPTGAANTTTSPHRIHFRFGQGGGTKGERHSQPPLAKAGQSGASMSRSSAPVHPPPKSLPPPAPHADRPIRDVDQLYTVIDKRKKAPMADDIEYADDDEEGEGGMKGRGGGRAGLRGTAYDSIDADSDLDGIYSKVGPPRPAAEGSNRRYDYPQFRRETTNQTTAGASNVHHSGATVGGATTANDATYQSASQIYAPGSEDPYSSIASGPRATKPGGDGAGDGDSSSAYDPGYARVRPAGVSSASARGIGAAGRGSSADDPARVEEELDQLYSKIRRGDRDWESEPPEGRQGGRGREEGPSTSRQHQEGRGATSTLEGRGSTVDGTGRATSVQGSRVDGDLPQRIGDHRNNSGDDNSEASRDPSYRYLTVRDTPDAMRERLRREGVLDQNGQLRNSDQQQQLVQQATGHPRSGTQLEEGGSRGAATHYYSTIGSGGVYETVDETTVRPRNTQHATGANAHHATTVHQNLLHHQQPHQPLHVHPVTTSSTASVSFAPLPPTSPIPDRNSLVLQHSHSPNRTSTTSLGPSPATAHPSTSSSATVPHLPPVAPPSHPPPSILYSSIASKQPQQQPRPGNGEAPVARVASARSPAPTISSPLEQPRDSRGGAHTVSPFGRSRHATVVMPEHDGFEGGRAVTRREVTVEEGRGGGEERGRSDRPTSLTFARERRDGSEDRATQTPTRPTVIRERDGITIARERRSSPVTVVSVRPQPHQTPNNNAAAATTIVRIEQGDYGSSSGVGSYAGASNNNKNNNGNPMTASGYSTRTSDMTNSQTSTAVTSQPYTTPDGILMSRRVTEERETIVRSTTTSNASSRQSLLHSDEDFDASYAAQSQSARSTRRTEARTRHDSAGSQSARDPAGYGSRAHSLTRALSAERRGIAPNGDRIYHVPITLSGSSQSLGGGGATEPRTLAETPGSSRSSRSSLPVRTSTEDMRRAQERSRERRDKREEEEARRAEKAEQSLTLHQPGPENAGGRSSTSSRSTSRTPTTPRRREEERQRQLNSTIYTGRDYVSPIDLSSERAWPLSGGQQLGPSTPPSQRKVSNSSAMRNILSHGEDDELTPRAANQPSSGRDLLNNNNINNSLQTKTATTGSGGARSAAKPPPIPNGLLNTDF